MEYRFKLFLGKIPISSRQTQLSVAKNPIRATQEPKHVAVIGFFNNNDLFLTAIHWYLCI
jgi:hypothetical protein